jgi:hypothetical protein
MPYPANVPIAAEHHNVAAVFSPVNVEPVAQDYPRAQEADARNNLACDAKSIVSGSR